MWTSWGNGLNSDSSKLTLVMADQLLQGAEGDAGRDVESSIVQRTDFIMFHCVTSLDIAVPDRKRVTACGRRERKQLLSSKPQGTFVMLMALFFSSTHF